jgi:hypothetical protein
MPNISSLLLVSGYRHSIHAPNADEAFLKVQEIVGTPLNAALFHAAVAKALTAGLIHDPVVLPEGALQCHWELRLTHAGLARARELIGP